MVHRSFPAGVPSLVDRLAALPGAVGVALGGSRATGGAGADSDWDLAVYYRGAIALDGLAALGEVHPPGAWGRLMNGGAWLRVGEVDVDIMLRDLDVVEHWTHRAAAGEFELDALLGYLAGIPTYQLAAELALGRVLVGDIPPGGPMPPRLVASGPPRWRFARDFSLEYARMHAARGTMAGVVGQAAKAAMEEAHARCCAAGIWTLNEKQLLAAAGLDGLDATFARGPSDDATAWVDRVAEQLGA
jgi:hypothetical protein